MDTEKKATFIVGIDETVHRWRMCITQLSSVLSRFGKRVGGDQSSHE